MIDGLGRTWLVYVDGFGFGFLFFSFSVDRYLHTYLRYACHAEPRSLYLSLDIRYLSIE